MAGQQGREGSGALAVADTPLPPRTHAREQQPRAQLLWLLALLLRLGLLPLLLLGALLRAHGRHERQKSERGAAG